MGDFLRVYVGKFHGMSDFISSVTQKGTSKNNFKDFFSILMIDYSKPLRLHLPHLNCQAQVQSPKVQIIVKGLGVTQ